MDYLQEAIEKARKEREGAIGRTSAPGKRSEGAADKVDGPTGVGAPGSPLVGVSRYRGRKDPAPSLSGIKYTTTRVAELDPKVLSRNRVIAGNTDDPRVESYRQLRSQVLSSMHHNGWRTLAVTSAREGAGKTLTSVNLALSISQEVNQTVMLVDLDLRDPSVHETLGLEIDKGIVDHLVHGVKLEEILINPGYPRLLVLPGLPQGHHVSELLSSPEMKSLVEDITNRYPDRIVIFDLPPLLRNDDAMVIAPNADACLLIVENGGTQKDELDRCTHLLKNANLLGTVLNKSR